MAGKNQRGPNMGNLLNMERAPQLAPKFANQLGKTATGFKVEYFVGGMLTKACSLLGSDGSQLSADSVEWVTIPEWERRRSLRNAPDDSERLSSLKRKFELRLAREFPANGPRSGSEADIQAWLGTLPFQQRRALLMSQKDFAKSFPQGFRDS